MTENENYVVNYPPILNIRKWHLDLKKYYKRKEKNNRIGVRIIGVYQIKNILNGKMYVGSSNDIERRFHEHKTNIGSGCKKLQNAIKKYGINNFIFSVLQKLNIDIYPIKFQKKTLLEAEQFYLDLYKPFGNNGYNSAKKADSPMFGKTFTKKQLKRISKGVNKHYSNEKLLVEKGILKERKVIDSNGKLHIIYNVTKFCKENSLKRGSFKALLEGRTPCYNGWKLETPLNKKCESCSEIIVITGKYCKKCCKEIVRNRSSKEYKFIDKNKKIYNINNMSKFIRDNPEYSELLNVIRGKRKEFKGWSLVGKNEKR